MTDKQRRWVSGTVFADGRPRIVNIKGIRMDAEFGPSMIYITNLDKPGFIGRFSSTLGEAGINIATFHVGREAPGANAIALIEIDGELPDERAPPKCARCRRCSRPSRCISRNSDGISISYGTPPGAIRAAFSALPPSQIASFIRRLTLTGLSGASVRGAGAGRGS